MVDAPPRPRLASASPSFEAARPGAPSRRERMRDFQTGLAERLRRAQSAPLASNRLGLQIGQCRLLIDLADAGEILAVPAVTPVPLTQPWYRGLANVRGNLLGIVDLSLFAGAGLTPLDKDSRVLAFAADLGLAAGILVSRMLGLRSAADLVQATGEAAPGEDEPFAPWLRARLTDAQRGSWHELDLAALTADPRFIHIART